MMDRSWKSTAVGILPVSELQQNWAKFCMCAAAKLTILFASPIVLDYRVSSVTHLAKVFLIAC